MKIFKVEMDLSLVIARLKKYRIYEYNSAHPIVFVEANDPDEACFKASHGLFKMILDQDSSSKARLLCKEIKNEILITKVSCK